MFSKLKKSSVSIVISSLILATGLNAERLKVRDSNYQLVQKWDAPYKSKLSLPISSSEAQKNEITKVYVTVKLQNNWSKADVYMTINNKRVKLINDGTDRYLYSGYNFDFTGQKLSPNVLIEVDAENTCRVQYVEAQVYYEKSKEVKVTTNYPENNSYGGVYRNIGFELNSGKVNYPYCTINGDYVSLNENNNKASGEAFFENGNNIIYCYYYDKDWNFNRLYYENIYLKSSLSIDITTDFYIKLINSANEMINIKNKNKITEVILNKEPSYIISMLKLTLPRIEKEFLLKIFKNLSIKDLDILDNEVLDELEHNFLTFYEFYVRVKTGGDWDYKSDDYKKYANTGVAINNRLYDVDDTGNIAYGYVGKAMGLSDETLKIMGGLQQLNKNKGLGIPTFSISSYYEDPKDLKMEEKGFSLYKKYGLNIRKDNL